MTTLNESNFDFLATMGNILKEFNKNENVELEEINLGAYGDELTIDVYFKNSDTARDDFFNFFESIGYMVSEVDGCTDEDYYDSEDYPNGAIVIPECATLYFFAEVKEVVYRLTYWDLQSK